jgi:hypothetical protein
MPRRFTLFDTMIVDASAWMTLTLTVGWLPGRDWVDTFGSLLGVFWIASLVFLACVAFV